MANKSHPIGIAHGNSRKMAKTVSGALDYVGKLFNCDKSELTCETAGPARCPDLGHGMHVWAWKGEFDADTAAMLWVPELTARAWLAHRGTCALA